MLCCKLVDALIEANYKLGMVGKLIYLPQITSYMAYIVSVVR